MTSCEATVPLIRAGDHLSWGLPLHLWWLLLPWSTKSLLWGLHIQS